MGGNLGAALKITMVTRLLSLSACFLLSGDIFNEIQKDHFSKEKKSLYSTFYTINTFPYDHVTFTVIFLPSFEWAA